MPEDMQGGLKVCLQQAWTERTTKRLIVMTDAPPHGKQYHTSHDDYPQGSPDNLQLEELMKELCEKEIDVQVIRLNHLIDKTIEAMKANHTEVDVLDMS